MCVEFIEPWRTFKKPITVFKVVRPIPDGSWMSELLPNQRSPQSQFDKSEGSVLSYKKNEVTKGGKYGLYCYRTKAMAINNCSYGRRVIKLRVKEGTKIRYGELNSDTPTINVKCAKVLGEIEPDIF
jgi:hypothetical protein